MTITLDLKPDIERSLQAQAQLRGVSLQDYVLQVVAREAKVLEPLVAADDRPTGTLVQRGQFLVIEGPMPSGWDQVQAIAEMRAERDQTVLGL